MSNLNLPSGWTTTTLGTFMDFKNGVNADKDAYGKGIKFVNVMDIFRKNCLSSDDVIGFVEITEKQLNEYSVVRGDILFNRTSETPEEIAFSSVYLGEEKITFGGGVIRGRQTKQLLLPEFAKYCFKTDTIRKEMIRRSQGAVRANISQKDLSKVPIVIPPETDQKMIISILDEWGYMIEKTEALIDAKERQFGWLKSKLLRTALEDYKDNIKSLPDVCKIRTGKKDVNQGNPNGQYPFFTCAKDHTFSDSYSYDMEAILLARNGYIGNPILYRGKFEAYQRTYILHDFTHVDAEYLNYLLRRNLQKKIAQEKQEGAMSYIKLGTLQSIEIVVPPIDEQKRIAHTLNTAKEEITLLKKLADHYCMQKRGLMQKLLSGKWRIKS